MRHDGALTTRDYARRFGAGDQLLMLVSLGRPKGGLAAPFGFGVLALLLLPGDAGQQDVLRLMERQPPVAERAQKAAFAAPFGTMYQQRFASADPAAMPISTGFTLAASSFFL